MGSWQLPETNCRLLWPEVGLTFSGPVRSCWSIPEAPRGFMFYHSASSMFFICCVDSAAAVCPGTVRGQVPLESCRRQPLNMLTWQYLQGRPFTGPRESLASSWSKSTQICKKQSTDSPEPRLVLEGVRQSWKGKIGRSPWKNPKGANHGQV